METYDVGIVGGGVIGLSIAYQLIRDARLADRSVPRILIIDAGKAGQASWAGGGILPPPARRPTSDPIEQLQQLSLQQMAGWSADLKQETGIDNQYRQCGGYYLALTAGEQAALQGLRSYWEEIDIQFQFLTSQQFTQDEPWLADQFLQRPCHLIGKIPGETQLRNPRHLQALQAACQQAGVTIITGQLDLLDSVDPFICKLGSQTLQFQQCVLAAGSWTSQWLKEHMPQHAGAVSVFPVKGQMLLYEAPEPWFQSVVNFGTRYFVPRADGKILVGSTEEEVGFDATATEPVRNELESFVQRTLPAIGQLPLIQQWAGFRPASYDHTPVIGRLRGQPNVIVATGHFRSGIQWSIGTAICVSALLNQQTPPIDLQVFAAGR